MSHLLNIGILQQARNGGGAAPSGLLLDDYPNAAAAYALRKLRTAYAGSAIRVRESGGNTEADIGFDGSGNLDTVALLAHCLVNDGFVVTWYDQSGNGNDATQSTAASQPQVVSSGSVILENGKPSLQFDGSNDFLNAGDQSALSFTNGSGVDLPISAFCTFKITNTSGTNILFGKDNGSPNREYAWGYFNESEARFFLKDNGGNSQISRDNKNAGQLNLHQQSTMLYDASEVAGGITFYSNGVVATMGDAVAQTYNGMANTTADFTIGNYGAGVSQFQGIIQEIVIYPLDQSTNRTGIETDINDFYSIY